MFSACGKIGDPLPPIPRAPLIVNELSVTQQGSRLVLSIPLTRTPRTPKPQRIEIYRLIESANAPLGVTQEIFSERAQIVATLPGDALPANATTLTTVLTHQDELGLNAQPKGVRYRYAVRIFNQDGRAADFSNYALIEPLTDLAAPPAKLDSKLTQTELLITWPPSAANENGTTPANVFGYHLYRKNGDAVVKLNTAPLKEPSYVDKSFAFGTPYEYSVRPLSAAPGQPNVLIEGNVSETLAITPRDTFAPAAPFTPTIASINAQVSLFWASNAELDLVGYNVYRAEEENTPAEQWIKLNQRMHTPTTFRDDRVQVGKRYFYRITAVDNAGNESPRSEAVNETVNP